MRARRPPESLRAFARSRVVDHRRAARSEERDAGSVPSPPSTFVSFAISAYREIGFGKDSGNRLSFPCLARRAPPRRRLTQSPGRSRRRRRHRNTDLREIVQLLAPDLHQQGGKRGHKRPWARGLSHLGYAVDPPPSRKRASAANRVGSQSFAVPCASLPGIAAPSKPCLNSAQRKPRELLEYDGS